DLNYRNYDPILGRMNQVDPMADQFGSLTTYNYSFNNSVYWNDRNGANPKRDASEQLEFEWYQNVSKHINPTTGQRMWTPSGSWIPGFTGLEDGSWDDMAGNFGIVLDAGITYADIVTNGEGQKGYWKEYGTTTSGDLWGGTFTVQSKKSEWIILDSGEKTSYQFSATANGSQSGSVNPSSQPSVKGQSNVLQDIWNSWLMRLIIPDVYTIDVTVGAAVGVGVSETYTLNLITRGNDWGFHRTSIQPMVYGGEIGYGGNIGYLNYSGPVESLSRETLLGPSRSGSAGFGFGVNVNAGYADWNSSFADPILFGMSVGVGDTVGVSYSEGETHSGWWPFWR
ncbi:MAG: hypothetical protein ABJB16_04290, partial [Saprospiraceae bacterium]